jgi:periplasmic copper chaperone A
VRRALVSGAVVALVMVFGVGRASAHNEFEPATAAPGSIVELTLFAEDEAPDAGTTKLQLQFPQPLTVVELPAVEGFTATVQGGEVGGPATGVTWEGGPAAGDLEVPITLGPLPTEPGRLQFKSIQTYDNGEEEAWIAEWPEGAAEPDHPGPVLDLVAGGPGSIPATTAAPTTAAPTTAAPTTEAPDDQAAADDSDDDSDSSALPIVIGVVVVLAAAGGAFLYLRSRRSAPGSGDGDAPS